MSERTMLVDASGNRYLFDAVFSSLHALNVKITDHPVQTGAAVADHAFIEPETVSLAIGMSDVMTGAGTIACDNQNRSVSAYQFLRETALSRNPLTLVTRLFTYENMLIESISAEETLESMHALRAEITLKKLNRVQVAEVSVQQTASSSKITYEENDVATTPSGIPYELILANQQYTGSTNSGTVSAKTSKYPVITRIDTETNTETFVADLSTMFRVDSSAYLPHRVNVSSAVKAYEAIMGGY